MSPAPNTTSSNGAAANPGNSPPPPGSSRSTRLLLVVSPSSHGYTGLLGAYRRTYLRPTAWHSRLWCGSVCSGVTCVYLFAYLTNTFPNPHRASWTDPRVDAVHGAHTTVVRRGDVCRKRRHLIQQRVLREVVPGAGVTPLTQHRLEDLSQWQQSRPPAISQVVRTDLHRHGAGASGAGKVGCITPALQCRPVVKAA